MSGQGTVMLTFLILAQTPLYWCTETSAHMLSQKNLSHRLIHNIDKRKYEKNELIGYVITKHDRSHSAVCIQEHVTEDCHCL